MFIYYVCILNILTYLFLIVYTILTICTYSEKCAPFSSNRRYADSKTGKTRLLLYFNVLTFS